MVQRTAEKNIALTVAATAAIMHALTHNAEPSCLPALQENAHLMPRLAYHIYHASWTHPLLNLWCLLTLVFKFQVRVTDMLAAYAIAVACPSAILSQTPIVGLSAFNYALMGIITVRHPRPFLCILSAAAAIAVGACFPNVATALHIYAYTAAIAFQLLDTPINRTKP